MLVKRHECNFTSKSGQYGAAINGCREFEDDYIFGKAGELWAGNDEYESQVNYCPYCGYEAKIKIKE